MNQDTLIREKVNEQLVKFSEAMSEGLKKPKKIEGELMSLRKKGDKILKVPEGLLRVEYKYY